MFEAGDVLRTWALAQLPRDWQDVHRDTAKACGICPPLAASNTVAAENLADHRRAYLDYEGPLSGDRGNVARVAAGTFDTTSETSDRWEIAISASGLNGRIMLSRVMASRGLWRLTHQREGEVRSEARAT
jgi:hypothetical protein